MPGDNCTYHTKQFFNKKEIIIMGYNLQNRHRMKHMKKQILHILLFLRM